MGIEAHGLGIDRDDGAEIEARRQIAVMQFDAGRLIAHDRIVRAGCGGKSADADLAGMQQAGLNGARGWCPGEDSNFHDLSATGT